MKRRGPRVMRSRESDTQESTVQTQRRAVQEVETMNLLYKRAQSHQAAEGKGGVGQSGRKLPSFHGPCLPPLPAEPPHRARGPPGLLRRGVWHPSTPGTNIVSSRSTAQNKDEAGSATKRASEHVCVDHGVREHVNMTQRKMQRTHGAVWPKMLKSRNQ